MTLMERRRALLASEKEPIDTTVEVTEADVRWQGLPGARFNKIATPGKGITRQYFPDPVPQANVTNAIALNVGDTTEMTYVLYKANESKPFDYWSPTQPRWTQDAVSVSFTVLLSAVDDAYCYVVASGEVLFAGKNTPYYGKTNINS